MYRSYPHLFSQFFGEKKVILPIGGGGGGGVGGGVGGGAGGGIGNGAGASRF